MDVLIFVDCQFDFLSPKGKLYVRGSTGIRGTLKDLFDAVKHRWHGICSNKGGLIQNQYLPRIVYTVDWHDTSDAELSDAPDWKTTFPIHCVRDTEGARIIKIGPKAFGMNIPYIVLHKNKFDVFDGCKFADGFFAQYPEDTNFYVCGVATNVCVKFVVEGLLTRKRNVFFVTDAMKELPGCNVAELFQDWTMHGAHGVDTKTACQNIRKGSAT